MRRCQRPHLEREGKGRESESESEREREREGETLLAGDLDARPCVFGTAVGAELLAVLSGFLEGLAGLAD